jgi:hypothetical protein
VITTIEFGKVSRRSVKESTSKRLESQQDAN